MRLAFLRRIMEFICHHCLGPIVGRAYRVTSEEDGVTLLDMTVCYRCHLQAKKLRLHTKEIDVYGLNAKPRLPREETAFREMLR